MHMKIKLITEEAPFHAIGEVRWYDVVRDTAELTYQLGVEFLEVKDIEKKQLVRFLKKHETNRGVFRKLFAVIPLTKITVICKQVGKVSSVFL